MKIWMSPQTRRGGHPAVRTVLPLLGGVALVFCLLFGTIILAFRMSWPMEAVALLTCLAGTAFLIWLAMRLGSWNRRDSLIFCQDDAGRLFAVDAWRYLPHRGGGLLGYWGMQSDLRKVLRNLTEPGGVLERYMAQEKSLVGLETQILAVERIRAIGKNHSLICRVRYPNQKVGRQTFLLVGGYEDEERLLYELERIQLLYVGMEETRNPNRMGIWTSLLILLAGILVCVLSHPALAYLPELCYFPSLGLSMLALTVLLYFVIRNRRGE